MSASLTASSGVCDGNPTFLAFSIDEDPSLKPTTTFVAPESFKFSACA